MRENPILKTTGAALAALLALTTFIGCAGGGGDAPRTRRNEPYMTRRDKTLKGAGIGAAAGAAGAVVAGKREADEILVGAAIGAGVGAGVGAYMDAQEEKLARIPGTTVERVDEHTLLVHFDNDVLFDVDSAIVGSTGRDTLEQVAGVLGEYKKTAVVVQGHTDSTGSEAHNEQLSNRRANAVEAYLVGRGVDRGRITSVGYGEAYPVASNASESGRQLNRRVDVLIKAKA
jgi:outer membrane protein OmpA-like peptidoglycan-associated protein